ncbi:MAG: metal ABC transporter substrate-binding protein [Verrucomicrobiota bacterium]
MIKSASREYWWLSILLIVGLCFTSSKSIAEKPLSVYVVNYPLQYFAERVGGDYVKVTFPAPEDGDPAFWQPEAEDVIAYQKADIILLNGATYAKWIATATLPKSKVSDTSESFKDQFIEIKDKTTHSHGPEGEHSHAGIAFTTWLDFTQAVQQAKAIHKAFTQAFPEKGGEFDENFQALERDLMDLDKKMAKIASVSKEVSLVASHPVYQYFKRRYGLNLVEVLWEPETYPEEESWEAFKKLHDQNKFKYMIWEGEPLKKSVSKLDEMGIKSLVFDPCGNRPGKGKDFLTVMKENMANLQMITES